MDAPPTQPLTRTPLHTRTRRTRLARAGVAPPLLAACRHRHPAVAATALRAVEALARAPPVAAPGGAATATAGGAATAAPTAAAAVLGGGGGGKAQGGKGGKGGAGKGKAAAGGKGAATATAVSAATAGGATAGGGGVSLKAQLVDAGALSVLQALQVRVRERVRVRVRVWVGGWGWAGGQADVVKRVREPVLVHNL